MKNIWSENKYVNMAVNILLFLFAINFMHYGQFILPIICLILFIDRRFKFKVNSIKIFIILCLFAISFFAFSYRQGFYSVMGFCLPMTYYIGSNIKKIDENNIKTIIYILAFGMMCHVLLNFFYEVSINGYHMFFSSSHYDVWTKTKMSASTIAVNYVFFYGILSYLMTNVKNRIAKYLIILVLIVSIVYCACLGERKTILILLLSVLAYFLADFKNIKRSVSIKYYISKVLIALSVLIIFFGILLFVSANVKYANFDEMRIISKFINKGLSTERIEILINTLKVAPMHLWGNREVSSVVGIMPHDLWLDVFDWGGIVTLVLLMAHTITFAKIVISVFRNKNISKDFKLLFFVLFMAITLQMLLEPIMSSATIFLLSTIIVESLIEKLQYEKE